MKAIIAITLFLSVGALAFTEVEYRTAFLQFMHKYEKSYSHDAFHVRYATFKNNMDLIEAHNNKGLTFTLAMNHLGDLTSEEYAKYYLGLAKTQTFSSSPLAEVNGQDLPASYDWRQQNAVTPVKDQGQCGSCWSFSTTGSTEGCHAISTGNLVSLSEQNLMDCSVSYGNQGCNGGLMTQAMQYIIANNGIDTEASYPYTAADGTCSYNAANVGATLKSFYNVQTGSESDLQNTVFKGPTSVAIDASQSSFQFYSSGVYYEPACSSTALDHGVLAVGWGTDATGGDYWIVKNSWNTSWGNNGYIWMSRNKSNNCGIATMATLPQC